MGYVLCSVPNTQEAEDAILLASIPHKATIDIADGEGRRRPTIGEPKFVPIEGTTMTYAVNTGYQVIYAAGKYYCCYNGVWFVCTVGRRARGSSARRCRAVIYTIPPIVPALQLHLLLRLRLDAVDGRTSATPPATPANTSRRPAC